jgi:hypothetical protein
MRHRVRRNRQAWKDIGASEQVLKWIREGVTIPFLNNQTSPPFNQVVSLLVGERELSVFLVTRCVHQPVESFSTTKQEKDNAVLPRSENSYVICRTLLTRTSRIYKGTSTLPVPSSSPGRFRTRDGPLVYTSLRKSGQRTPSQLGYTWYFAKYTNNIRTVSRGLRTPYEKVLLQRRTISVARCRRSSFAAVGPENRT